jgi:hypothetical protein
MKTFATEVDAAIAAARAASEFTLSRAQERAALEPVVRRLLTMPADKAAAYVRASHRGAGSLDVLAVSMLTEVAQRRAPRASYRAAIEWIAGNDDTSWLEHDANVAEGTECIAAALVADVWGKTTEQVRADLQRAVERMTKGQA